MSAEDALRFLIFRLRTAKQAYSLESLIACLPVIEAAVGLPPMCPLEAVNLWQDLIELQKARD